MPNPMRNRYLNGVFFGTGFLAVSIFIMLAILHRHLNVQQYADFATFWSIVSGIIAGVNAPLETTGVALTRGDKRIFKSDVIRLEKISIRQDLLLASALALVAIVVSEKLPVRYESIMFCLAAVLVGYSMTYAGRGFLIAKGATGLYGGLMSAEGILRIALILVFANAWRLTAVTSAVAVGVAALASGFTHRKLVHDKAVFDLKAQSEISRRKLTLLTISSMSFLGLANAEPIAAYFIGDAAWTGDILNALTLARSPLLFVAVLQALVIPTVIHNRSGKRAQPNQLKLRMIVFGSGTFIGVFSIFFTFFGNELIDFLYGGRSELSEFYLLLLVLSPACLLIAMVAQSILIVINDLEWIASMWVLGLGAFIIGLFIPLSPVSRIIVSGFLSGLVLVAAFVSRTAYLIKTHRL